jgi:glycosyltransferase involved in cell wall biosynthesis
MTERVTELNWGFVAATYQREHILTRCLRLAAEQTRPPAEIIVVDASPNWLFTREQIERTLVKDYPFIRWQYVQAAVRSQAWQLNQGIQLATSDIVFLFDDGSLMYPDCADNIMKVYEADSERRIAGILAAHVPVPPDLPDDPEAARPSEHSTTQNYGTVARLIRRALDADSIFVPYDKDFPKHEIPKEVRDFRVGVIKLMPGWGMTFPRAICLLEPFSDIVLFYGAEADSDMSYRASRHGPLLVAGEARLCHLGTTGGRSTPFLLAAFRNLNAIALLRLYSTDLDRSRRRERLLLARRFLILLAKDFYRRKWSFPNARGLLFAYSWMSTIFGMTEIELREWYPRFQQQTIKRYGRSQP